MVCENVIDFDYRFIDGEVDFKEVIFEFKWKIIEFKIFVVVDCEGKLLSRKGVFIIIIVVIEEKVFIFDVFKLG